MEKLRKFQETIRTAKKSGDRSVNSASQQAEAGAGAMAQEGSGLDGEVESYHGQVSECGRCVARACGDLVI